MHLSIHLTD